MLGWCASLQVEAVPRTGLSASRNSDVGLAVGLLLLFSQSAAVQSKQAASGCPEIDHTHLAHAHAFPLEIPPFWRTFIT